MMKFRSKAIGGLALAVASITALAACSSSSTSSGGSTTNGNITLPGGIGSVPLRPPAPSPRPGRSPTRFSPGPAPTRSSRIPNSGNNTVNNAFQFQWEMWRPLYWPVNGTVPEIEPEP